ncbi:putative glucose-6-phosphate isomerase [Alphaproteobacteria bacterium]|nr:putative glucose-6-phosphate isomerase [Alphaproteobacteria bacterium]
MTITQNILSGSRKSENAESSLLLSKCISLVKSNEDLHFLEDKRLRKWLSLKKFVIFGTGGSSLGGQCIHAISGVGNKVTFVNNLDPHTLKHVFSELVLENTGFLCISKSGETIETISQLLLTIELLKSKGVSGVANKIVLITEDRRSSLREIATKYGFFCIDHPQSVGGRFSVFSAVGMLPAVICGIDPMRIRKGAEEYHENYFGPVIEGAHFVSGHSQHISFIYSDKLSLFGNWLAQLYAESSGKYGMGVTPITAIGSVDQHSQLQLYLDGPRDKCFTFFLEKQTTQLTIAGDFVPSSFSYLKNKNVSNIFEAQYNATIESIVEKGLPVRKFEFPTITPEIMGALFMHFMLEVVAYCRVVNVNAFDQPAVERCKIITKNLLGAT